jgi:threonine dehydrogenase-like Zn-dependent dehydrogenase
LPRKGGAETLTDEDKEVQEKLRDMTNGRGPDHCIDAVGLEAHGATLDPCTIAIKTAVMLETDRSSRVACGDIRMCQGWNGFHPGRLWRVSR